MGCAWSAKRERVDFPESPRIGSSVLSNRYMEIVTPQDLQEYRSMRGSARCSRESTRMPTNPMTTPVTSFGNEAMIAYDLCTSGLPTECS